MDLTTTNVLVGGGLAVLGSSAVASSITALVGRRQRNRLTEAQAKQAEETTRQLAEQKELARAATEKMRDDLYKQLLDEVQEELSRRTARIAELETRINELEVRVAEHDVQETVLRRELAAARDEQERLRRERDRLMQQVSEVTAERDRMCGELGAKDRQLADLQLLVAAAQGSGGQVPVQRQRV